MMQSFAAIKMRFESLFLNRWRSLNANQRVYVGIGGSIIIILCVYYLIVAPVNDSINNLQQEIIYQQSVLEKMQPQIAQLKQLQMQSGSTIKISPTNLLGTIDQSLKSNGLNSFAGELSQSGNDGVQIKFTNVPFDGLSTWFISLWKQYHIQVSKIDAKPTSTLGNVDAVVTLSTS